jgi:CRISPR-associated protein Cas1
MQIYLDSFGAYLSVKNGQFRIRLNTGAEHLFAVRKVNAILLTRGTGMSADAALLAVENNIPLLLIDAQTHFPKAHISGGTPQNIATVRKKQPLFGRRAEGLRWVAQTLARKIENQRELVTRLAMQPRLPDGFTLDAANADRVMARQQQSLGEIPELDLAPAGLLPETLTSRAFERFRGLEGTASRSYFALIGKYLGEQADFAGRFKRPAYDPMNAVLNYLYGMLYTGCHLALLKSGLDPYLGVMHADRHGDRPTLVYDFIEPYRPWADAVAIDLMKNGTILEDFFEPDPDERGLWLSGKGKGVVIDAMLEWMEKSLPYGDRNVKRKVQIDLDAQQLAGRMVRLED